MNELTPEAYLEKKTLKLSTMLSGYEIPYAYLMTMLEEYNDLKTAELIKKLPNNDVSVSNADKHYTVGYEELSYSAQQEHEGIMHGWQDCVMAMNEAVGLCMTCHGTGTMFYGGENCIECDGTGGKPSQLESKYEFFRLQDVDKFIAENKKREEENANKCPMCHTTDERHNPDCPRYDQ